MHGNIPRPLPLRSTRPRFRRACTLNLIDTVHNNMDKMYRYVALRKKLLGVDELHMYDVYTLVVPDAAVSISYDEAKKNRPRSLERPRRGLYQALETGSAAAGSMCTRTAASAAGVLLRKPRPHPMFCSTRRTISNPCSLSPTRWVTHCTATTAAITSP